MRRDEVAMKYFGNKRRLEWSVHTHLPMSLKDANDSERIDGYFYCIYFEFDKFIILFLNDFFQRKFIHTFKKEMVILVKFPLLRGNSGALLCSGQSWRDKNS